MIFVKRFVRINNTWYILLKLGQETLIKIINSSANCGGYLEISERK